MFGRALGLRPVLSWAGLTMTTLMPLGYREATWWLRARLVTSVHGYGLALGSMRREIERGRVCFELDQAHGTGTFVRWPIWCSPAWISATGRATTCRSTRS